MRTWRLDGSFGEVILQCFSGEFSIEPSTNEDIYEIESIMSQKIPLDYKTYLQEIGGGYVSPPSILYYWSADARRKLGLFLEENHDIIENPYAEIDHFYSINHNIHDLNMKKL